MLSALRILKQENHHRFETNLNYTVSSWPAWATWMSPIKRIKTKKEVTQEVISLLIFKVLLLPPTLVVHIRNPSTQEIRQENCLKFKVSLGSLFVCLKVQINQNCSEIFFLFEVGFVLGFLLLWLVLLFVLKLSITSWLWRCISYSLSLSSATHTDVSCHSHWKRNPTA